MPVPKLLRNLGYLAATTYLVIGLVGGPWPSHWDNASGGDQAALLVSVGAFFGALPIFWTGVALVLAVVIVLLAIRHARAPSRAARRAEPIS
jgi:hypothetical protein